MKNQILSLIERNSRLTPHEISVMTGFEEKSVCELLCALEKDRVICGYNTLIDWDKTDKNFVTALIEVKVVPQRGIGFDKIAKRIINFDEVKACYLMSGGFDFTIIVEGKTIKEVAAFVSEKLSPLESVMSTATHFVLKKYKDHGVVIEDNKDADERMAIS